ncbi:MAG TPA: crosslink repair DNA glycosylase YcaQ family protein [Candidatus Sulfotelmatobacter sp.]|nr:crosslink repair DNA glycosylase YcaQ family protein [Candidatus Sulfotelmatobacter sp.]
MSVILDDLRRMTVARSLFLPTTLKRALDRMQFVQADPIRAPARAQDLILRHRVRDYRAGDLERRYTKLGIEEDFFINYGFATRQLQLLMHPRSDAGVPAAGCLPWPAAQRKRAQLLLDFVHKRGSVHPREVDEYFAHGTVKNYWGGSSNATTHLLDAMHYQGLLRIVRRDAGIRVYAAHEHPAVTLDDAGREARLDVLADAAILIYAPLPLGSLRFVLRRLRFAAPQWEDKITAAIHRARQRLVRAEVDGVEWYWPADWKLPRGRPDERVRLLAPFDPVVWDRWRFEKLWGWTYRFEAYTPAAKRVRGYYAMPMLWRDRVTGWGNLSVKDGSLIAEFGYVKSEPRDPVFKRELEAELGRMREFLGLGSHNSY